MPMSYRDHDTLRKITTDLPVLTRQPSEESIRTKFCDGPLLESDRCLGHEAGMADWKSGTAEAEEHLLPHISADERQELIQRLKRERNEAASIPVPSPPPKLRDIPKRSPEVQQAPLLLPAIELRNITSAQRDGTKFNTDAHVGGGWEIERPRSALHAGNFNEHDERRAPDEALKPCNQRDSKLLGSPALGSPSPSTSWRRPTHSRQLSLQNFERKDADVDASRRPSRSRAPSLHSYSSSFVLKPPTSPLVQQANNDDLDLSMEDASSLSSKADRRHTLPPNSLQSLRSWNSGLAQAARHPPSFFREDTFPKAISQHQRRSLGASFPYQASLSPPTSNFLRSRRMSFSSDASPHQHSSLLGSYEESILRGRMSGTPSKPLDFTATIGALGKNDCKPKHPAHVSLTFPAVFHSWGPSNSARSTSDDEPSPYVGQVDLEHNLPPPQKKERRSRRRETLQVDERSEMSESPSRRASSRRRGSRKRRSRSRSHSPTKLPIGGSYRIPQEGHLQILIKNPNKTAVKLFLVPYDLHGMEVGTKTFIRQVCYSAGPVLETPISSKSASESTLDTKSLLNVTKHKPTLRYMIHIHICCPSKGRFYLYKNISVVFANRVPDNKENLRNEIKLPEPRYSAYRPNMEPPTLSLSATNTPLLSKSQRRRTYGYGTDVNSSYFEGMRGINFSRGLSFQEGTGLKVPPVPPIPASFATPERNLETAQAPLPDTLSPQKSYDGEFMDIDTPSHVISPMRNLPSRITSPLDVAMRGKGNALSPILSGSIRSSSSNNSNESYNKLSRGENGYGGLFGRPGTPEPGEGLLARKLKGLDVDNKKMVLERKDDVGIDKEWH